MLDKPDIEEGVIIAALGEAYGLDVAEVSFLPLGADWNAAVYRAAAAGGVAYFVKLRRGPFDEIAVAVPSFLQSQGIAAVMAPIPTRGGQPWTDLADSKLIVYPFVEGPNGFDAALSGRQWRDLGAALRGIHAARLPQGLARRIPREAYSPRWRESLTRLLARSEVNAHDDPAAAELTRVLRGRRAQIEQIVERSARLAATLRRRARPFVLCHTDLHGWNVLLGADDTLHIVDWDSPHLAPKERDLMFVRGEVGGVWYRAADEAQFCAGYGQTEIDVDALSYYRFERIVEDIAVSCEMVFSTEKDSPAGAGDRELAVRIVADSFRPNQVVDLAYRADG